MPRPWAAWRRAQYVAGLSFIVILVLGVSFFLYWYEAPSCFDNSKNGDERGVDCGGSCMRICSLDVREPEVLWSKSFKIIEGQYNAVAYVENPNNAEGTAVLSYVLKLFDSQGLITERKGTTVLPPRTVIPIFEGRIVTGERTPTRTEVELSHRSAIWQRANEEGDQFTVVNRELKNADVAPKLIASLTNKSLDEAQNVDVVATIFDSHNQPLTTSATYVSNFPGRTTKEVIFTWPEPIAKTIRSCEVPTDVILAIDLSGSMNDDGGTPPEPVSSVLKAAEAFVSRLKKDDQAGVVTYATNAILEEVLSGDKSKVAKKVRSLTILKAEETGSTNTGDALSRAYTELSSSRHNPDARKVLVLLSDGLANAPEGDPEAYALERAQLLKTAGVNIYTIGLGEKVNDAFMSSVASLPAQYLKAATADRIDSVYRTITGSLCEEGAAVIEIVPKYPGIFAPLR